MYVGSRALVVVNPVVVRGVCIFIISQYGKFILYGEQGFSLSGPVSAMAG
jgi:hypothetical protein